jgi:hypothetical protein
MRAGTQSDVQRYIVAVSSSGVLEPAATLGEVNSDITSKLTDFFIDCGLSQNEAFWRVPRITTAMFDDDAKGYGKWYDQRYRPSETIRSRVRRARSGRSKTLENISA